MLIPTTSRLDEIAAFSRALAPKRRNFEGTSLEKAREQYRYSKIAEVSLAEYLNERFGTDYAVDLTIHSQPTWEPDLVSDNFHSVEVKTCMVSGKAWANSWVFQYPRTAVDYPHAADRHVALTRKVDKKLVTPELYSGTTVALTTIDKSNNVSLEYVVDINDIVGLLRPLRNSRVSDDKTAVYDDSRLRALYRKFE